MNEIDVRAVPKLGQFEAQFRRVHKASYETVRENGAAVLFPTADKAKVAAWEAMTAHLTTLMRRDGETVSLAARAAAEALFTRGENDLVRNPNETRITDAAPR